MTPASAAHLSCFSRFVEVTGPVPKDFQTRPVGSAALWCTPIEMVVKNFGAAGWEGERNDEGYSEARLH